MAYLERVASIASRRTLMSSTSAARRVAACADPRLPPLGIRQRGVRSTPIARSTPTSGTPSACRTDACARPILVTCGMAWRATVRSTCLQVQCICRALLATCELAPTARSSGNPYTSVLRRPSSCLERPQRGSASRRRTRAIRRPKPPGASCSAANTSLTLLPVQLPSLRQLTSPACSVAVFGESFQVSRLTRHSRACPCFLLSIAICLALLRACPTPA